MSGVVAARECAAIGPSVPMNPRAPQVAAVLGALTAISWIAWSAWTPAGVGELPAIPSDQPPPARPVEEPARPAAVVEGERPVPVEGDAAGAQDRLSLPDGSFVPNLNGVPGAMKLRWPAGRPFAPIRRVVRDSFGNEHYLHEDGSQSTTLMVWREDLGRPDPAVMLSHPRKARALRPTTADPRGGR